MTKEQFKMILNFNGDVAAYIDHEHIWASASLSTCFDIETLCKQFGFKIIGKYKDFENEGYYDLLIKKV